jgi:hypothetical protein
MDLQDVTDQVVGGRNLAGNLTGTFTTIFTGAVSRFQAQASLTLRSTVFSVTIDGNGLTIFRNLGRGNRLILLSSPQFQNGGTATFTADIALPNAVTFNIFENYFSNLHTGPNGQFINEAAAQTPGFTWSFQMTVSAPAGLAASATSRNSELSSLSTNQIADNSESIPLSHWETDISKPLLLVRPNSRKVSLVTPTN